MSSQFPQEAHLRGREYIFAQARPLERELYRFHFEDGSQQAGLAELAQFQNTDGGFHSLEADVRLPESSAICTSVAFQVLREIGATADEPLVQRGVAYLLETFDAEAGIWWQVPPTVNDYPHAPWWHWTEKSADPSKYVANARAELAGYLNNYASLVPADFLISLNASVFEALQSGPDEIEMHDLLCYLRFAETESLHDEIREGASRKLLRVGPSHVTGPDRWGGYGLKPLDVAPSTRSLLHEQVRDLALQQFAWELTRQGADGAWSTAWEWRESYPEAWAHAEREWKGVLTLKLLVAAKDYGLLE